MSLYSSDTVSSYLQSGSEWVYMVDWILVLILSITFFFRFNRFVGAIITFLLRISLWQLTRISIHVQAIQVSVLGGRLVCKNLTIMTPDYTIAVLRLDLSWRYWLLRKSKTPDFYWDENAQDSSEYEENSKLPCRFKLTLDGFEAYYYNRTAAYDDIVEALGRADSTPGLTARLLSTDDFEKLWPSNSSARNRHPRPSLSFKDTNLEPSTTHRRAGPRLSLKVLLRLFPLRIRIRKGAMVLGNAVTPSVLTMNFKEANGEVDCSQPHSVLDRSRFLYDLKFDALQVWMKPNMDYDKYRYSDPPADEAVSRDYNEKNLKEIKRFKRFYTFRRRLKKMEEIAKRLMRLRRKLESRADMYEAWRGLRRYIENNSSTPQFFPSAEEYARHSLILNSDSTRIVYYYDNPGVHLAVHGINVSPPEHGVEIELTQTTIYYGPWADKQRIPLQQVFFPSLLRNEAFTATSTKNGADRAYSGFAIAVMVKDELICQVPTREPSKDKDSMKRATQFPVPESPSHANKTTRPYGWIEIKMAAASSILYWSSYAATKNGYTNDFRVSMVSPEVRTSVNHDILFTSSHHQVTATLQFPLVYDATCDWSFDLTDNNAKVYLFREHVALFSDLFSDFGSGDPTPYQNIRPVNYHLKWDLKSYSLFFNVNDANIVNNPLDMVANKFMIFQGDLLGVSLDAPMFGGLSKSTRFAFSILTPRFDLVLNTPAWHTNYTFSKDSDFVGKAHEFRIHGSYLTHADVQLNTCDVAEIHCIGDLVTLKCYGYVVKYLFTIKENYFGDHKKFKTFEEFVRNLHGDDEESLDESSVESLRSAPEIDYWKIPKLENDIDVIFTFQVRQGLLVLPYHVYNSASHISLHFDSLDIDLRFTNYYMDLQADFSEILGTTVLSSPLESQMEDLMFEIPKYKVLVGSDPDIIIDGLAIHGHRMFGIPPEEITYFCRWDFDAGEVSMDSEASCLGAWGQVSGIVGLGFNDLENVLDLVVPLVHDVVTVSFSCPKIAVICRFGSDESIAGHAAILLDKLLFTYNDIANLRYSSKASLSINTVDVLIFNDIRGDEELCFHLETTILFNNFCQKVQMEHFHALQQEHVKLNDAPFHRCPFILEEDNIDDTYNRAFGCFTTLLTLPDANKPLTTYSESLNNNLQATTSLSRRGPQAFTLNYEIEEKVPLNELDPSVEHDGIVVELGPVHCFVSPNALELLALILEESCDTSLDSSMDRLHLEMIMFLVAQMTGVDSDTSFRVVCQEILINVANESLPLLDALQKRLVSAPHLSVVIRDPSLALSLVKKLPKQENLKLGIIKTFCLTAFHLRQMEINPRNITTGAAEPCVHVSDLELWALFDDDASSVTSFNIDVISMTIDQLHTELTIDFVLKLAKNMEIAAAAMQKAASASKEALQELVYVLALASETYQVDHDPGVLTKPTNIVRSNINHIRSFHGWKTCARLRHVLDTLPVSWKSVTNEAFIDHKWRRPTDAYDQLDPVLMKWREWEADTPQRSEFLRQLFDVKDASPNGAFTRAEVGKFVVDVQFAQQRPERVLITDSSMTLAKSFGEGSYGIGTQTYDCCIDVGKYDSYLLINSLRLARLIKLALPTSSEPRLPQLKSETTGNKQALSFVVNVDMVSQIVSLPHLSLQMTATDASSFGEFTLVGSPGALVEASATLKIAEHGFRIHNNNSDFIQLVINDLMAVGALSGSGVSNVMGDISIQSISCSIRNDRNDLLNAVDDFLTHDFSEIEKLLEALTPKSSLDAVKPPESESVMSWGNVSLAMVVSDIAWSAVLIPSIQIRGSIHDNKVDAVYDRGCIVINSSIEALDIEAVVDDVQVAYIENSRPLSILRIEDIIDLTCVSADFKIGNTKILCPQIVRSIILILKHEVAVSQLWDDWKSVFVDFLDKRTDHKQPENSDFETSSKIAYSIKLLDEYVRLYTFLGTTKYSSETEGVYVHASNFGERLSSTMTGSYGIVPVFGECVIPSTRFYIINRSYNLGLSNILDLNIAAKLLNTTESEKESRMLQVESKYCRLCFSPPVILRVLRHAERLSQLFPPKAQSMAADTSKVPFCESMPVGSIQFFAHNLCIGWLFDTHQKDYPGVMLGAEKIFAVSEHGVGKLTLTEAYISVANGARTTNFYSALSEKHSLNRAFLPRMQAVYTTEGMAKCSDTICVNIQGDELDVKFLSTSIILLEEATKSVTEIRRQIENQMEKSVASPTRERKASKPIKIPFKRVELVAKFAGSIVLLYRLNDETSKTPPSLLLRSPTVLIAGMYEHLEGQQKSHQVKLEVLASQSENILYSYCVPVLIDILSGLKSLMKHQAQPEVLREDAIASRDGAEGFDDMLSDLDLHFGLRIEEQSLTLSCAPTAKVAAIVKIGGIYVQCNTGDEMNPTIVSSVLFEPLSASLQHVYSREISGSVGIDRVVLLSRVEGGKDPNHIFDILGSDVNGFINVKQVQDLHLFKDIWFPKEWSELYSSLAKSEDLDATRPLKGSLMSNSKMQSKCTQVAETRAYPWVLTAILTGIMFEVDLGQSIGVLRMKIDELWGVSEKTTDWAQDLKVGIKSVVLESEGRLGGSLQLEDIQAHTGISWRLDHGTILQIPLVMIYIGIGHLYLKASFDFHAFIFVSIESFCIDVVNRTSQSQASKDYLYAATQLKSAEIFVTSLTASTCYDIYNTVSRMAQDSNRSYKETLRDEQTQQLASEKTQVRTSSVDILKTVRKLEGKAQVIIGRLLINIYPSSLDDSKVLTIKLDESVANFLQGGYSKGVTNKLDIEFNDLKVLLSKAPQVLEEFVANCTVAEYVEVARKTSGGSIFVFPSFKISMTTFQEFNTKVIEYLYQSSFGGTVDIRWNLGSINFIREMYSIHEKTLKARQGHRKRMTIDEIGQNDGSDPLSSSLLTREDPTPNIDRAIADKLTKITVESTYTYRAMAPPIIEAPRLKELGNATPPLEWFGVHRDLFPNVTHQYAIVSMQKVMHEVEAQYSKLLGKA